LIARLARTPTITLALALITIVIALLAPENSERFDLLVLDRAEPRWWPWLSAHVLHTDAEHLGWNVLALLCLGWLGETQGRLRFAVSIALGVAAVDVWFAWFNGALRYYCGLSGVLNTVLLATLFVRLRRTGSGETRLGVAQRYRPADPHPMATRRGCPRSGIRRRRAAGGRLRLARSGAPVTRIAAPLFYHLYGPIFTIEGRGPSARERAT
jgi:hypothetical protein